MTLWHKGNITNLVVYHKAFESSKTLLIVLYRIAYDKFYFHISLLK
jgi:hypothetical protein